MRGSRYFASVTTTAGSSKLRFRNRKNPKIELETSYKYPEPGKYSVVVKVMNILGNDATKTLNLPVK